MKKIAIAIALFGTASLNAMTADQMAKECNDFSKAVQEVTSSAKQLSCILDPKEDTKQPEMATKELVKCFGNVSEILSGYSNESKLYSDAVALQARAEYCRKFFSIANCIKELPDEQMKSAHLGLLVKEYAEKNIEHDFIDLLADVNGFHNAMAQILPQTYDIDNGMIGMNRDVILKLLMLIGNPPILRTDTDEEHKIRALKGEESKVRAVIGMSGKHHFWINSDLFRWVRRRNEVPGKALPCYRKAITFAAGIPVKGMINYGINPVSIKYNPDVYKGARVAIQSAIKVLLPPEDPAYFPFNNLSPEEVNLVIETTLPKIQAITSNPLAQYETLMLTIYAAGHVSNKYPDPVPTKRHLRELFPTCKEAQEMNVFNFRQEDTGGNELCIFYEQLWCLDWDCRRGY